MRLQAKQQQQQTQSAKMSAGRYQDAYLMNESFVFYASINTFKNPIFDSSAQEQSPNENYYHDGFSQASTTPSQSVSGSSSSSPISTSPPPFPQKQESTKQKLAATAAACSKGKVTFLPSLGRTRQKWTDFCDNLTFSIRGKVFVMETNFKRRVRALRKFLNKQLPPWILPASQHGGACNGHLFGGSKRERKLYQATANGLERIVSTSRPVRYYEDQQWQATKRHLNLSEPISAKALGVQQGRILNRLERIKRDNQRLLGCNAVAAKTSKGIESCQPTANRLAWSCSKVDSNVLSVDNSSYGYLAEDNPETLPDDRKPNNSLPSANATISRRLTQDRKRKLPTSTSASSLQLDPCQQQQVNIPIWLQASDDIGLCCRSFEANTIASATKEAASSQFAETRTAPSKSESRRTKLPRPWTSALSSGRQIKSIASKQNSYVSDNDDQNGKDDRDEVGMESDCESATKKKTCIVCYERAPNIVTLPCEHSDICSDCFIEIIYIAVKSSQFPLRCVLCRQRVERIRCSRRLMLSVIKKNRTKTLPSLLSC